MLRSCFLTTRLGMARRHPVWGRNKKLKNSFNKIVAGKNKIFFLAVSNPIKNKRQFTVHMITTSVCRCSKPFESKLGGLGCCPELNLEA